MISRSLLKKSSFTVFWGFFLIGLVLYLPASEGKFLSDMWGRLTVYHQHSWEAFTFNFNDIGLHPLYNSIALLLYQTLGLNEWMWQVFYVLIHSGSAVLVFLVSQKFAERMGTNKYLALTAGFLFLISPFQTEAVVWAAGLDYLLATFFYLTALYLLIAIFEQENFTLLFLLHLSFLLGIMAHEIALTFPLASLVTWLIWNKLSPQTSYKLQQYVYQVLLVQFFFCVLYLLISKLWLGQWVGHYGPGTHLKLNLFQLLKGTFHYIAKFLLFFRYLPDLIKNPVITGLSTPGIGWLILFIPFILCGSLLFFIKKYRKKEKFWTTLYFGSLFLIALLPVLNLDQSFTRNIQTDRYGYLAAAFIYPFLTYALLTLFRRRFLYVVGSFGIVSICLLIYTLSFWKTAGHFSKELLKNFSPYLQNKPIYILNMPDNYRGVYLFRVGFRQAVQLKYGKNVGPRLHIVAWHNIHHIDDGVIIKRTEKKTILNVQVDSWGRWFWYYGRGATSYETTHYYADFEHKTGWYQLRFKTLPPPTGVVLYHKGTEWHKVNL